MNANKRVATFFYIILTIYLSWIFLLPAFPTQDGPIHLYYAHVLQRLWAGSPQFGEVYFIRHNLPPESTHIYLLVGLLKVLPSNLAQKVIAAISVICIACGLRYLMKSLCEEEPALTIFAVPLALSWPLFEDFTNFLLGLGLAMFGIGMWKRASSQPGKLHWILLVALSVLLVVTHPIGLLVLLIFCCLDSAAALTIKQNNETFSLKSPRVITLGLMFTIALYVLFYVTPHFETVFPNESRVRVTLIQVLAADFISPIQGPASVPIRIVLLIFLLFFIQYAAFGLRDRIVQNNWQQSDILLLCSAFLVAGLPFIPFEVNGAAYVGQRMVYVVWLSLLAAAGGNFRVRQKQHLAISIIGATFAISTLALVHFHIIRIATVVANVQSIKPISDSPTGILVSGYKRPYISSLSFDPFTFSGADAFLQGDAVLLNGPWLWLPHAILGGKTPLPYDDEKSHPLLLPKTIAQDPSVANYVRSRARFVMVEGETKEERNAIVRQVFPTSTLDCKESQFYAVCTVIESGK